MTTTQRLKARLIAYLGEVSPSDDIAIVDARQRVEIELPTLSVDVPSAEAHSVVLANVQRCEVEIVLRCHAGDEADTDVDEWIDQIESALNDPSAIKNLMGSTIRMDHWLYTGSVQDWDESVMETTFSAECLVTRV